ncbi:MAG: CDP-diacylglycerol--serine O-phosphatidyltransferase [Acidobacteria bacterium]|nr:CDP-diacylglycerol--serine O-phosphatidyltransferase [Acidobacteriota bacterium]
MSARHRPRRPLRPALGLRWRGVAGWLPGAMTLGNLLAGFVAILLATQHEFLVATVLVLAAAVLDGLDGRVARLTGTASDFGEQLDSLADAVSFGVAPSMLAFQAGVAGLGRAGWAICFLFTACGLIRLARFNAFPHDHRFFIGLPIPMAASIATCPILLSDGAPLAPALVAPYGVLLASLAILMVSRIRYRSFKDVRFGPKPYRVLALWAALLGGLLAAPQWVISAVLGAYLVSPLCLWVVRAVARPRRGRPGREGDHPTPHDAARSEPL